MHGSLVVRPRAARFSALFLLCVLAATPAAGQTSRRQILEAERAAKAQSLAPYTPGKLEKGLLWMEEGAVMTRLFDPYEGWYVHFGGLTKGGGLGMGDGTGSQPPCHAVTRRAALKAPSLPDTFPGPSPASRCTTLSAASHHG